MDIETFDFESRVAPDVRTVISNSSSPNYTHEDLWRLIQAWYDNAEHWDNQTLGQCAYELSALIGPLAYAAKDMTANPMISGGQLLREIPLTCESPPPALQ